jgi:16S rRNA processing protein RimM
VEVPRPGTAPEHDGSTLTVRAIRWHGSRLLVRFAELRDRTAAEAARGWVLHAAVAADEAPDDPDEFYDHQLVGLAVETTTGQPVGELAAVLHGPGQDLLSVRAPDGREILVPFVAALVQIVDVPGGRVVVEDRPGLLDPAVGDEEGGA